MLCLSNTPGRRRQSSNQNGVRGVLVKRIRDTSYCVRGPCQLPRLRFLVRSSSALADLKLRGEEETEAGLGHLEGNAEAETKYRRESLRLSYFHEWQTYGLRNRALGLQRGLEEPVRSHRGLGPNRLSARNQLCDLGQVTWTL